MKNSLSEKWIKASIAGTIWAASEIVLGSFLHNLKVPFSGNILTAIGIIILISISYLWTDKGLFWRAGIICALMKTMSPSTVIFGPMLAIFTEAVLIEASVRLLGRTIAGYVIGSMMAMSWNLAQKILNYIIFYGSNIIEVYTNLLNLAQKQLDIQTNIVWMPIIILLIIYALFGLLAAITGIRVGRKMINQPFTAKTSEIFNQQKNEVAPTTVHKFNYSIAWLFLNIALMTGSFIILNSTEWFVWSLAIIGIIIMWSFRYKRALRQISKPKFWIFFIIITLITAFVFTRVQSGENLLQQGLLTGLKMNFRAAIIIVGFSVLGTELFNPVIRNFFQKTTFKNLPMALELSVESLPSFIANIPDFKSLIRNPVSILYQVISQADKRLSEIKGALPAQKVFIITGSLGGGKTTYAKKLVDIFKAHDINIAGLISEKVRNDSQIIGYDLVNLETEEKEIFLREHTENGSDTIGKFTISPKGLAFGNSVLKSLISSEKTFVIIDEIGSLELRNKGWTECLNCLIEKSENHILLVVRDIYLKAVMSKWNLTGAQIFNIHELNYKDTGLSIIKAITST